jgi:hypothetical protein
VTGKNWIMIYHPKDDGTLLNSGSAEGDVLALSIPRSEAAAIRHFARVDVLWIVRAGCECWHMK